MRSELGSWHELTGAERPDLQTVQLAAAGFQPEEAGWLYQETLPTCGFILRIWLNRTGRLYSQLIDHEAGTPYILHLIDGAQGAFVGLVREEYAAAWKRLIAVCTGQPVPEGNQLADLLQYARRHYQDEAEYPWEDHTSFVLRHARTRKWYALFMLVQPDKLGLPGHERVRVLNLHGTAEQVVALVDGRICLPGYHMNKKTWYTICLDGNVPLADILPLLEKSYALAAGPKK